MNFLFKIKMREKGDYKNLKKSLSELGNKQSLGKYKQLFSLVIFFISDQVIEWKKKDCNKS